MAIANMIGPFSWLGRQNPLSVETLVHRQALQLLDSRGTLAAGVDGYLESLSELHVAIAHHLDWQKTIHHALLLDELGDPADIAPDAAHRCCFGRWYDGDVPDPLRGMALFGELGASHESLHAVARTLLLRRQAGQEFDRGLYAKFVDAVLEFNRNAQRLQVEVLTALVVRDPLTGVLNRGIMRKRLEAEWARFERLGHPCAVTLLDVDRFKSVNDRYGHQTGDFVLRELASALENQLRAYDHVFFRFGGEEFLLCLPGISPEALPSALERLRRAVEDLKLELEGAREIRVTASLGAAFFRWGADVDDALRRADEALYAAKRGGRNRVCIAGSAMI